MRRAFLAGFREGNGNSDEFVFYSDRQLLEWFDDPCCKIDFVKDGARPAPDDIDANEVKHIIGTVLTSWKLSQVADAGVSVDPPAVKHEGFPESDAGKRSGRDRPVTPVLDPTGAEIWGDHLTPEMAQLILPSAFFGSTDGCADED